MAQGDKRLFFNTRERFVSDDLNRLQAIEAAERAANLRGFYNDILSDWYSAGGLQTPVVSSSPSLVGDVYGGLMVQPDNAGYFLVQPGVAGFLDPAGVGVDDNPYRLVNDPGQQTPAVLAFTSNSGGGSPRWDVVECQPVDTVIAQESRYIFNPATGIASPVLVDKVKAGRLTYRVRVGTVGAGFPGLAAGWMPLAVVCAPAGSSSLLTSDVWDVRPLVRERTRPSPSDGAVGYAPVFSAEYRLRDAAAAVFNQFVGYSEASWNGYQAGGRLERSTPSTLAQFGSTAASGGRAGVFNLDIADNRSTYVLAADARINLLALFPAGLPRWQRYSQVAVGAGRIPNGPRGILVVTTSGANSNGSIGGIPLPASMAFGASTANGCLLASTTCDGGSLPRAALASDGEHWTNGAPSLAGTVSGGGFYWDISANVPWPYAARRVLVAFKCIVDNTAGTAIARVVGSTGTASGEQPANFVDIRMPCLVSATAKVDFQVWLPCLPRNLPPDQNLPTTMRVNVALAGDAGALPGMVSATMKMLAWSSSDR